MIYPSVSSRTGDPQDDLSEQRYGDGSTAGGSAPTVAIYVDRPHVRQQVREDAVMTGYRVVASGSFEDFARASRASRAGVVLIAAGAVLVAESAHAEIGDDPRFRWSYAGAKELKNIAADVKVYRARRAESFGSA